MKSNTKKRLIAFMLCMVLVLSSATSAFADEPQNTDSQSQTEAVAEPAEDEATRDEAAVNSSEQQQQEEQQPEQQQQQQQPEQQQPEAEAPTVEAPAEQAVTYESTVDGVKVVVTAPNASVLPENAVLNVTKIEKNEEIEQIKDAIAPEVANNQTSIKDMMAFDIKFTADGKEVQPNGEVKVEFQNTGYDTENGISVYHVDDEKTTATDMQAVIDDQLSDTPDVAIDTTHFSTYVVVNNGNQNISVTIQHYLYDEKTKKSSELYKEQNVELKSGTDGQQLSQFTKENDEFVLRATDPIMKVTDDKEEAVTGDKIEVDSNVTIRCYYVAQTGTYTNGVTMFDYDITGGGAMVTTKGSWNTGDYVTITVNGQSYSGYYSENTLYQNQFWDSYYNKQYTFTAKKTFTYDNKLCTWEGNGNYTYQEEGPGNGINTLSNYTTTTTNDKIMMGQANETKLNYKYMVDGAKDNNGNFGNQQYDINANNQNRQPIIPGIVTDLSGDNYSNVNFKEGLDEPGYFTSDSKTGKRILDDYNLNFTKNGNKYTLTSVSKGNKIVANDLKNFWPLDSNLGKDGLNGGSDDGKAHNWYFAMRYDFKFKLGDYMGDLTYSFNGDDDLWVFMDGKPIIDLGGLHSAYPVNSFSENAYNYSAWTSIYPNTVDLWEKLGGKESADRDQEHTITVLFMERGGYGSNCNMEFVLPNVTSTEPVVSTTPKADLSLKKVDSKNAPIPGATFKLVSGNSEMKATSNASGNVTFANLREGTEYTLTEEKAPDNYVTETTRWTVTVEKDASGTLKAVLYKNNQPLTLESDSRYHIINYTQKELVDQSVESDKKVSLLDWDERTYKIDLTASSTTTQSMKTPYDIVMVLDQSGSMNQNFVEYKKLTTNMTSNGKYFIKTQSGIYQKLKYNNKKWTYTDSYTGKKVTVDPKNTDVYVAQSSSKTKLQALKNAATKFVNNVAEKNSDCRVGIVTFSSRGDIKKITENNYTLAKVGTSKDDIIKTIDALTTGGDTHPAEGLNRASQVFSENSSGSWENVDQTAGRRKMVVFLTDGVPAPRGTNDFNESLAVAGTNSAKSLHDQGVATYALGIFGAANSDGTMDNASVKRIDEYMQSIASSPDKYMTADSVDNLSSLFESITNNIPVTATVTDVIDSRFELTANSRELLEANGATITINNDGSTTITWKDTAISGKKVSGTTEIERAGWHRAIVIKAKDKYIGGNDVPTNGAGSGIDVDNNHAEFPQPTVNVEVDFNIDKDKTVIFKGDKLSQYFTNEVADGITKLVSTTKTEYTMLNDVNVSIKWYTDETCTQKTTKEAIQAAKPTADTVYYAKVTVTPKTDGSASKDNSVGDEKADGGYYKVDSTGVAKTGSYTVKVVSGAIQIEKQLETAAAKEETFTFRVTRTDAEGSEPIEVSITIKSEATKGTLSSEDLDKLKALPRGTYEVTEVDANGYTIQGVKATEKTNCYSNVADDKVSFTLGSDSSQKDVITEKTYTTAGILGVAAFTNEKVTSDWGIKKVSASNNNLMVSGAVFKLVPSASGSSLPTYYGKSQADGTVKWYSDDKCKTEIEGTIKRGNYTLSELTAPTGYICSAETWSIEIASKGALKSIQSGGQEIAENKIKKETVNGKEMVYYLYENEAVYALPSAGGTGIYLYMIGGMLLMFAAVWILYKNKCKEVLGK